LQELASTIEWEDVDVSTKEVVRWDQQREYFSMRLYRLTVGKVRSTM